VPALAKLPPKLVHLCEKKITHLADAHPGVPKLQIVSTSTAVNGSEQSSESRR
jgi:hypothetical protein